jgi:creatinine amidohydrolase
MTARSEATGRGRPTTGCLEDMTWRDVADAIGDEVPIALPVGSIEQHGHHMPLGTDAFLAYELARRVGERHPLVIAPPLVYASRTQPRAGGYGRQFAGSTGICGSTLTSVCRDVLSDFLRQGFRKVLILNGHMENAPFVWEALEALKDGGADGKFVLVNWWEQIREEDLPHLFPEGFPGWEAEHAGVVETSLMEELLPQKVRSDLKTDNPLMRILTYDVLPTPDDIVPPTGVPCRSTPASAEIGRYLAPLLVERITTIVLEEFQQ